jgi:molybdate transport system ATP-binding protein
MGSGKTTLLRVMAGQLPVQTGAITRPQSVAFVSFREESNHFSYSNYFYQQRYQATMSDDREGGKVPTLRDFLQIDDSAEAFMQVKRLGLEPLLDESLIKLSNGQTRKARIGRALLQQPAVLVMDNPFVGLDAAFRNELTVWLSELVSHGLTLVWVTEPNDIGPFVTHVIALRGGVVQWAGLSREYAFADPVYNVPPLPPLLTPAQPTDFREAFRLGNVTVRYGDKVILNAVNWTVRAGERWALLGPNGAGKSVLLSLLYGDHPQAYANDVSVFGHRRGKTGESIWDVKRRIGFVSPELHLYFPQHLTARQVALTGMTNTLTVPTRIAPETEADLQSLLAYFNLADEANRTFGTLSAGEQRIVLLIRALLKNPAVLLLDEPFQALDAYYSQLSRQLLNSLPHKTMLFITHNRSELPNCIDQFFTIGPENNL